MKTLWVSAGGKGSRINDYITDNFPGLPKHLLPVQNGSTLLSEIVAGAASFDEVAVITSDDNHGVITNALSALPRVRTQTDDAHGPMGPMIRAYLARNQRTFGCAGDFYCELDWEDMERFHDSHDMPITILVAPSTPTRSGARFLVDDSGVITSWERVDHTSAHDLINIGAYILDPHPVVTEVLQSFTFYKEDPFFDAFIPLQLVAGYRAKSYGFNVNTAEVYRELVRFANSRD